jgi:arginyl-tRNA synthetase
MDLKKSIVSFLNKQKLDPSLLEVPPSFEMGHFAYPCFSLSKEFKRSPSIIAKDFVNSWALPKNVEKIVAAGPYVNFFIDPKYYNQTIIESKFTKKKSRGKIICLDFSQPNIMKPFGVGHLRSTMIGNAIYGILTHQGYKVVRINHLGDWGTQFGKMMYAFETWGDETKLQNDPMTYMNKLYVKFHAESEKDSSLIDIGREWFAKLEQGDKKARYYWKKFSQLSLKYYDKTYKRLNVGFDSWNGEAFYEPMLKTVISSLDAKGLLSESDGAKIVDLEGYGLTPAIIQKADGATIYLTRDIAAARFRAKEYNFSKNLYVVDVRQSLHFKQLFKVLELAGDKWVKDCAHISFGLMKFKEGIMSTRKGKMVFLEDLLDKSVANVLKIINNKNPGLKRKAQVAEQVGVGAVVFWDLSHDRIKDLFFDMDKVVDFNGETGPYVQYTHARAVSILKKIKETAIADYTKLSHFSEKELLRELSLFEGSIESAASQYKPSIVAKQLIVISQRFNSFYQACSIQKEDDPSLRSARLALVSKTIDTLSLGLDLLGIKAPKQM